MEEVPKESKTIAALRERRVAEKIKEAKRKIYFAHGFWNGIFFEILIVTSIVLLNLYQVKGFLGTASPSTYFSGPIVPFLAKLVELAGIPFPSAIQIIAVIFFVTFPLSYYFFVKQFTGRKLVATFAVLFSSLPVYPFAATRIETSFWGIDSAHVVSLTLIPIALYGLTLFVRSGGLFNLVLSSFFSAVVALVSPFGFMTLIIFAAILVFSEVLLGKGRLKVFRFISVFLFAGGLSSFWYNPGFFVWMLTGPLGEDIRATVSRLIPMSFFAIPVLGTFGYLLFDRKPHLQPLFLAVFFTIVFAFISIAGGGFFPSHPSRYVMEFGISVSMLLSVSVIGALDYLNSGGKEQKARYVSGLFANFCVFLLFVLLSGFVIVGSGKFTKERNVLGMWDDVDKGEIWRVKEGYGGPYNVSGYLITIGSILGLGIIGSKGRGEQRI